MSEYRLRPQFTRVSLVGQGRGKIVRNIAYLYENRGTPEEDHHLLIVYTDNTYSIAYKKKGEKCVMGLGGGIKLSYDMFIGEGELQNYLFEPVETEEEAKKRRALEHLQLAASELGYDLIKK